MILQANALTKSYRPGPSEITALDKVDFAVERGETVAIVGPSGSGKSTLLSLLAGLDQPSSGYVSINGQNISALQEDALSAFRAEQLGIVFQQFHLMPHLSALENVALPLELMKDSKAFEKALAALKQVGLEHRIEHKPATLSGGECQRVAIARALVVKPALLLADEPSGNLDEESGKKTMDLFFDLVEQQQMTMVLVTHNMELAARCHRQLTLRGGSLC